MRFLRRECRTDMDAGTLIRILNGRDPQWLYKVLTEERTRSGWWLLPNWMWTRRFLYHRSLRKVLLLPVTLMAFLVDLYVFLQANLELQRGRFLHYPAKSEGALP